MDVTPLIPEGRKIITGYGGGGFQLNEDKVEGSLLLYRGTALGWPVGSISEARLTQFEEILTKHEDIELLLVGTGAAWEEVPQRLEAHLRERDVRMEVMDTGAACRTYNVLLSEERRVAAALIAV